MDGIESLARVSSDDSKRSRLLKQVLKSSAQLDREIRISLGGSLNKGSKYFVPPEENDKDKAAVSAMSSRRRPTLGDTLSTCARGDAEVCEQPHIIGRDLSPILRSCGERVGRLSAKLSSMDEQKRNSQADDYRKELREKTDEELHEILAAADRKKPMAGAKLEPTYEQALAKTFLKQRELAKAAAVETDEDVRIEIVPRGTEPASAVNRRADGAAMRSLNKHARFPALEDLEDTIDMSPGYDQLRSVFPRKKCLHPNLLFMTDVTLNDPSEFREAIWRTVDSVDHQDSGFGFGGANRSLNRMSWKDGSSSFKLQAPPTKARSVKATLRANASAPNLR
eukprot:TRINITY_DN49404_c0_g1_i1.p1 TRINITY_DN49404_c0_g1~~TRINITY_DN49404_c0_g1_i1.p1  ORF type:complete len:359 (+),score=81.11 TRINITY_DN49404_c0_g1_i1:64-1077(+)